MNQILFRPVRRSDYPQIKRILCDIWHFDRYASGRRTVAALLDAFLAAYLLHQNYSRVALLDGRVVGFLLGRCEGMKAGRGRLGHAFRLFAAAFSLALTKEGRRMFRVQRDITLLGERLLWGREDEFDGELVLFATDPSVRGAGVGKRLLKGFNAFLRENGAKRICLLTDSWCNYGFYEHLGYERLAETTGFVGIEENEKPSEFYLYGYEA